MYFSILGPLEVRNDGALIPIRGTLRRTLLAALLLNRDTVVSADRLTELLWDRDGAPSAATPLYNQIMRLRQVLDDDGELIRAIAPGYLIHARPDQLDLTEFTELCTQARQAVSDSDWFHASARYTDALALWRGEILADVPDLHEHPSVHRLEEDRLVALQSRIEADLNLGRHDELIGELKILTAAHPLHETFHAQLMLALHRSGRQAEALDTFRALRQTTVDDLGLEPGAAIQALHTSILNADDSLALREPPRAAAQPQPQPRQLPADTRLFTGRRAELGELLLLARDRSASNPASGTVVISAINGMGGVGKTALAIHAAHTLREHYPDGQLFIDLHGYSANLDPVAPENALDYLLRTLGVPPQAIPNDLDERSALYRSTLAETRTLIVLDNAVNAAQVHPLLPAAPGCLVLITSRRRLTSLDDAHLLALDVLPREDAVALLRGTAGPSRAEELADGQDAAAEIVAFCDRMPLAIRIVAARLRDRSTLTMNALADELREATSRLDHLDDGERDLASVFNSSLRVLPDETSRLFRLLGLVPGPDFDAYVAAHLLAVDLRTAERHLEALLNHSLLVQHQPARYRFHDLLRAHAATEASADAGASAAFDRLMDYYLATAQMADEFILERAGLWNEMRRTAIAPVPTFADRPKAESWLRSERTNLVAAILQPTGDQVRRDALIEATAAFLRGEGPWGFAAQLQTVLVASARRRGDRLAEASALEALGNLGGRIGELQASLDHLNEALKIFQDLGNRSGEARSLATIGNTLFHGGRFRMARKAYEAASVIYREVGPPLSTTRVLGRLANLYHTVGRNASALEYLQETIAVYRELGSTASEANSLLTASRSFYALGNFDEVRPMLDEALVLAQQSGNKMTTANILQEIARQQIITGEYHEASQLLDLALELHLKLGFRLGEANIYWERGRIALAHGRHESASEWYAKSLTIALQIGSTMCEAQNRDELAKLHRASGDHEAAGTHLARALAIYRETEYLVGEAEVHNGIAALRAETDGPESGLELYRESLATARRAEHPLEEARALDGMARCEVALGERESAIEHLEAAVDLYRRMRVVDLGPAAAYLAELTG